MRIKDGFVMRDVAGQAVVIATGEASKDFHGMVKLNETGAVIWRGLEGGLTLEAIAQGLASDYYIDSEKALSDVEAFAARMRDQGFVEA